MTEITRPRAVLVAVALPDATPIEFRSGLDELRRLVTTLGYDVVAEVTQARAHLSPAAVIGEGKLDELAALTGGSGDSAGPAYKQKNKAQLRREAEQPGGESAAPDLAGDAELGGPDVALVAVDHELTPSQLRNLERATGTGVLDRTGVIIEIFHRHAKSREARLQVEIARLGYATPRLREAVGRGERQAGKGAGEDALELDRRKVRDRIKELRDELARIQTEQDNRRANRSVARRVALVGYTNAGKSSLMRGLTGSDVYVENKLFATLDTTVRALQPEVKPRILVSDTVGFIKKLPHDLVASFKSTLDEALDASLLLHVVDASDPQWPAQYDVTRAVLDEIGAKEECARLLFNKIDQISADAQADLARRYPTAWFTSAHAPEAIAELHQRICQAFEDTYQYLDIVLPYGAERVLAQLHAEGKVSELRYEADGTHLLFAADAIAIARAEQQLAAIAGCTCARRAAHAQLEDAETAASVAAPT